MHKNISIKYRKIDELYANYEGYVKNGILLLQPKGQYEQKSYFRFFRYSYFLGFRNNYTKPELKTLNFVGTVRFVLFTSMCT